MRFVAKLILSKIYAHLGVKNWTEISIRHYKCLYIRKGPPESTQDGMYVNMEKCCYDTCRNWCIDEHVKDSLVKIWSILGHIGACREANRASGANIRVGICFSTGDRARHIALN